LTKPIQLSVSVEQRFWYGAPVAEEPGHPGANKKPQEQSAVCPTDPEATAEVAAL